MMKLSIAGKKPCEGVVTTICQSPSAIESAEWKRT